MEYAFDVKLAAVVRVHAKSEKAARAAMNSVLDSCEPTEHFLEGFNGAKQSLGEGVRVPSEPKPDMAGFEQYAHSTYSQMPAEVPIKAAFLRKSAAVAQLQLILAAAFPKHDNRSDYQSDYFDYCWSFN